jgi:hypothetical protein
MILYIDNCLAFEKLKHNLWLLLFYITTPPLKSSHDLLGKPNFNLRSLHGFFTTYLINRYISLPILIRFTSSYYLTFGAGPPSPPHFLTFPHKLVLTTTLRFSLAAFPVFSETFTPFPYSLCTSTPPKCFSCCSLYSGVLHFFDFYSI